ncbi:MAG: FHA domain-containing protein [Muribaculaceae bacterium]|jgi:hypothetical protein|nr:FHA domain-containing protein [Muribaculaceae bacterium]
MTEIFIGRDEQTSKLRVSIGKEFKLYGENGSVPMTVSRQHCSLLITDDGRMSLNNLQTGKNYTYVNGVCVESKHVTKADKIELGPKKYRLDLSKALIDVKLPPKTYNIKPIEKVWNDYHETKLNIQIKERKFNAVRSVTGILTPAAVLIGWMMGGRGTLFYALYVVIFVVGLVLFIYAYSSSSKTPKILDKLDNDFRDKYVCPNQDCHRFLGYNKYSDLLRQGKCGCCGSKFCEENKK